MVGGGNNRSVNCVCCEGVNVVCTEGRRRANGGLHPIPSHPTLSRDITSHYLVIMMEELNREKRASGPAISPLFAMRWEINDSCHYIIITSAYRSNIYTVIEEESVSDALGNEGLLIGRV